MASEKCLAENKTKPQICAVLTRMVWTKWISVARDLNIVTTEKR